MENLQYVLSKANVNLWSFFPAHFHPLSMKYCFHNLRPPRGLISTFVYKSCFISYHLPVGFWWYCSKILSNDTRFVSLVKANMNHEPSYVWVWKDTSVPHEEYICPTLGQDPGGKNSQWKLLGVAPLNFDLDQAKNGYFQNFNLVSWIYSFVTLTLTSDWHIDTHTLTKAKILPLPLMWEVKTVKTYLSALERRAVEETGRESLIFKVTRHLGCENHRKTDPLYTFP